MRPSVGGFIGVTLLLAVSTSAQTTGLTKVSDVIEGGHGAASVARCGSTVIAGFGDVEPSRPNSFNGLAVSHDSGVTFAERGTLAAAPDGSSFDPAYPKHYLGYSESGSPSLACASATTFYYASGQYLAYGGENYDFTQIVVSTSTDGGKSWGVPVVASSASFDIYYLLDFSPTIAVDPSNPRRLYIAYIDNNFGPPNYYPDCFTDNTYIVELVSSSDGGKTWSAPLQVDHACEGTGEAEAGTLVTPNVMVAPDGRVYIAYEFLGEGVGSGPAQNEIRFLRSADHGLTFGAALTVSTHAINEAMPQLAVDRTSNKHRGEIYLTWSGSPTGAYTDTLISESLDFGRSFSFPRSISPAPRAGTGRHEVKATIAVDFEGDVAVCYENTSHYQPNVASEYSHHCALSFNHGATWQGQRVAANTINDYEGLTSDFLGHQDGFFTDFSMVSGGKRYVVGKPLDLK